MSWMKMLHIGPSYSIPAGSIKVKNKPSPNPTIKEKNKLSLNPAIKEKIMFPSSRPHVKKTETSRLRIELIDLVPICVTAKPIVVISYIIIVINL